MVRRATLSEIRTAVASVGSYQRYAGCDVATAVDVVCDWMRLPADRDRRIIRNAVLHRDQEPVVADSIEAAG